jgi:dCMP deaminase
MNKWDNAYMAIAQTFSQLSSARRAKVGCCVVKDNRVLSVGYNGMPSGWDNNCEDVVITEYDQTLKTKPEVLHAETNAIAKVARSTESCEGATLYCTMLPCLDCAKLTYQSGIDRIVYRDEYPKGTAGLEFLLKCGLKVEKWEKLNEK